MIVLLQPTSPLRRAEHIDGAVNLLFKTGAGSVVSVVEVPHQYNPISVMKIEDGQLVPFLPGEGTRVLRRQDKPRVYARNGPAVLATRTSVLFECASFYGERVVPYLMREEDSIDIDTPFSLLVAELLLAHHQGIA